MTVNIYRGDLEACRVCLATDIKLISLQDNHLKNIYSEFSGVPMIVTDSLPQHICTYCCALLKKCFKFQQKCKDTNNLLMRHLLEMHALTTSFIDTLDRSHLTTPLVVTDSLECNCIPEPDIICAENKFTFEQATQTDTISILECGTESIDGFDNNQDSDDGLENKEYEPEDGKYILLEVEPKAATTIDDEKQENKDDLNTTEKIRNENEERIDEFKNTYCNKIMNPDKESFYLYILEKYLEKNTVKNNSYVNTTETPAPICTDNYDIEYSKEDTKIITKLCHSTENVNQKRLYEFINSRYVNGDTSTVKQKKIKDIDKMKIKKPRRIHNAITKDSLAKISKQFNVDVKLLLKEEKMQDLLDRKETDKYKNSKYKCELCYTGFASEKTFQNHKAAHDPSAGPYECEVCHLRFKVSHQQRHHFMKRHMYKFICRECGRVMRGSSHVREHHKTHSGFKYTCEHCDQLFNTYSAHLNHLRIHHGSVSCDICHMKFTSELGLIGHKTKAHRELFKCAMCLISFHNGNALRRHQELTAAGAGCGAHIKPCTQCGEIFLDEATLARHMDDHQRSRLDVLKPRQREYPKTIIRRPKQEPGSTAQQAPYMCEICAKTFNYQALLNHHQSSHSDERPFACQQCDKTFKNKFMLKTHTASHTDERPFQCAHCVKAFRVKCQLVVHMRQVHSEERPFPCPICHKRFKLRYSMTFHVRTVHEGQPTKKRIRKRKPAGNNKQ